jgi:hypothetical protein
MPTSTVKRRKRRFAAPIGGLFILLALVGLAAVVWGSLRLTGRVLDNGRERTKIEELLRPLVMFDPVPFESPADIDSTQILYYCMWHALMNSTYGYDENQEMLVPASDLSNAAVTLFGPEITLTHQTFGDYDLTYYYNSTNESYNVPTWAELYVYSPMVESIEREGDLYKVAVGYLPPAGAYTVNFQGDRENPTPDKYLIFMLRPVGGSYQIAAIRPDERAAGQTHIQ